MTSVHVGVLASGTGSNFQALVDADLGLGKLAVLISNVADAPVLERARRANVSGIVVDHRLFPNRERFEAEMIDVLRRHSVNWIVLAGFMRILTKTFLEAFPGKVVNIHPALCPSFPGRDAQAQALAAGVKITGCTVHLVDQGVDTGPILAQAAVPVLPDDNLASLKARILREEHALLPAVVRALCSGALSTAPSGRPFFRGILRQEDEQLRSPWPFEL